MRIALAKGVVFREDRFRNRVILLRRDTFISDAAERLGAIVRTGAISPCLLREKETENRMSKQSFLTLILVVVLLSTLTAQAGRPLETVRVHVENVLTVLRDTSLKGASGEKIKKDKIRTISEKE